MGQVYVAGGRTATRPARNPAMRWLGGALGLEAPKTLGHTAAGQ